MIKQDKYRIVRIIVTAGILSIVLAGSEPSSFAFISGQDSKSLARMGITLDNPSLSRTAISLIRISEEEAIQSASRFLMQNAGKPLEIRADYVLLTNSGLELFSKEFLAKNPALTTTKHLIQFPAYIVSIKGISKSAHAAFGQKPLDPLTEQNVAVDAVSGEILFSFFYR
ncbi:hypothetical protein D3C75_995420 [compost metagenome]